MDGQGTQILQQVGDLLTQLAQQEQEPTIQRAIMGIMKQMDPLMQLVGQDDQQDMSSGLATPNGPPGAGGPGAGGPGGPDMSGGGGPGGPPDMSAAGPPPDMSGGGGPGGPMPGGPPDMGGQMSSEGLGAALGAGGGGPSPKSFGGARKAAMANYKEKGHFSKSGSKGEKLQTEKTKNRNKR